jgi:hypothetical protein
MQLLFRRLPGGKKIIPGMKANLLHRNIARRAAF